MIGSFGGFGGMGLGAFNNFNLPSQEEIQARMKASGIQGYGPPSPPAFTPPTPVVAPRPAPVAPTPAPVAPRPAPAFTPPSPRPAPVVAPRTSSRFQEEAAAARRDALARQEAQRKAAEKAAADAAARKAAQAEEARKAKAAATRKPVPVMPMGNAYTSVGPNLKSAYTPTAPIAPPPVGTAAKRGDKRAPGTKRPAAAPPPTPTTPKPTPVLGSSAPPELKSSTPKPVTSTPKPMADPAIAADALKNMRAMTKNMTPEQLRGISTYAPGLAEQLRGPTTPKSAIQSYKDTLLGAADKNVYDVIDDVDEVDDFYDMMFRGSVLEPLETDKKAITARDTTDGKARGSQYLSGKRGDVFAFTPDEYISEVGAPEYLKGLKSGVGTDKDVIRSAYGSIANTGGTDTAAALSNYYGFDVVPSGSASDIKNFGGNYEEHTNASQEQISEFQSLIKPVLAETIPYLQATEGLDYQDALLEAYKRDPMIQSMYAKYGVQPVRQTKDGSTYLYDPMTFGEIRTKEVKDSSVKDALKVAAIVGLSLVGGGALAGTAAFGGGTSAAGSALAYGTTSAGITAATGGDTNDILKSFALAGAGGYAKGLNAAAQAAADTASGAAQALSPFSGGVTSAADAAKMQEKLKLLTTAAETTQKTADTFGKVVQGAKFIDAAVDGDIAGAAVSAFGPKFTTAAMDKVGLNEKFLEGYNINQDDAVAGLVKTQIELTKGTDFGDAIARGFGEYIMEGGALAPNNVKTPKFIKMIGDVIKASGSMFDDAILQPVKGFVEGTVEVLGDVAEPVVDVIEDVAGAVVDKAPLIEDAVRATGSAIEDVVKPIVDPLIDAAPVVEDAVRAIGSTVDDVIIEPVKELVEGIVEAAPDVDLPDVDLPRPTPSPSPSRSSTPTRTPSIIRTPGIIEERGAELFDLGGEQERKVDPVEAYLASLAAGGMANGGAVRSSYGNLDELLRIVGGK